jgi:hypothetical protein
VPVPGLSETSRWLRIFTVCPRLDGVVDWATKVEDDRRLGLVAITANTGQVIAHAGWNATLASPIGPSSPW